MPDGPYLVPATGGAEVPLTREYTVVGRVAESDLRVNDSMVSRQHARFARRGAVTLIEDLGSSNGTFVNGRRVHDATPLRDGDTIQLGNTSFTYRAAAQQPAGPAPYQPGAPGPQYGPMPGDPMPPPQYGRPTSGGPPAPSYGAAGSAPPPQYGSTSGPPPQYGPISGPPSPQYGLTPGQPPLAPHSQGRQVALEGPGAPPVILTKPQVSFGRAPTNDIVLTALEVAPRHAIMGAQGEQYFLTDLGSGLGTFVNGHRITAPQALQSGDEIRIGPIVFRFRRF